MTSVISPRMEVGRCSWDPRRRRFVALAAAVRPHDATTAPRRAKHHPVREGLEAEEFQSFQAHVRSSDERARWELRVLLPSPAAGETSPGPGKSSSTARPSGRGAGSRSASGRERDPGRAPAPSSARGIAQGEGPRQRRWSLPPPSAGRQRGGDGTVRSSRADSRPDRRPRRRAIPRSATLRLPGAHRRGEARRGLGEERTGQGLRARRARNAAPLRPEPSTRAQIWCRSCAVSGSRAPRAARPATAKDERGAGRARRPDRTRAEPAISTPRATSSERALEELLAERAHAPRDARQVERDGPRAGEHAALVRPARAARPREGLLRPVPGRQQAIRCQETPDLGCEVAAFLEQRLQLLAVQEEPRSMGSRRQRGQLLHEPRSERMAARPEGAEIDAHARAGRQRLQGPQPGGETVGAVPARLRARA